MKFKYLFLLLALLILLIPAEGFSQCAMCRAVLESGDDQEVAKGLNNGIIYLMAVPYVLIGALGYVIYRKMK